MTKTTARNQSRKRLRMVQDYERHRADTLNGRTGMVTLKVAPGRARGYHSMSQQEGQALCDWIAGLRTFMGIRRR